MPVESDLIPFSLMNHLDVLLGESTTSFTTIFVNFVVFLWFMDVSYILFTYTISFFFLSCVTFFRLSSPVTRTRSLPFLTLPLYLLGLGSVLCPSPKWCQCFRRRTKTKIVFHSYSFSEKSPLKRPEHFLPHVPGLADVLSLPP